jgi:hypothetical protein
MDRAIAAHSTFRRRRWLAVVVPAQLGVCDDAEEGDKGPSDKHARDGACLKRDDREVREEDDHPDHEQEPEHGHRAIGDVE